MGAVTYKITIYPKRATDVEMARASTATIYTKNGGGGMQQLRGEESNVERAVLGDNVEIGSYISVCVCVMRSHITVVSILTFHTHTITYIQATKYTTSKYPTGVY